LHFQMPEHAQGKLVSCLKGSILDVIVDIRKSSDTYGKYISVELNESCYGQLWVPPGFLHGYVTTQDNCEVAYKVTNYYSPKSESTIVWNDKLLNINWGTDEPLVSEKDKNGKNFNSFESPFL
jgi:dTDP-4-dehydrorhamnose 3,5-epimerase